MRLEESNSERRRSERFVATLPVGIRRRGFRSRRGRSWDIAERGVCINARAPVEIGTLLELHIEVIIPTRVSLGFDFDALVVDGPSMTHLARLPGVVRRCVSNGDGTWDVGIEFADGGDPEDRRIVDTYIDHLRDGLGGRL